MSSPGKGHKLFPRPCLGNSVAAPEWRRDQSVLQPCSLGHTSINSLLIWSLNLYLFLRDLLPIFHNGCTKRCTHLHPSSIPSPALLIACLFDSPYPIATAVALCGFSLHFPCCLDKFLSLSFCSSSNFLEME